MDMQKIEDIIYNFREIQGFRNFFKKIVNFSLENIVLDFSWKFTTAEFDICNNIFQFTTAENWFNCSLK